MFFGCATINDYENMTEATKCSNIGPNVLVHEYADIIGFLLSGCLVYLSFFIIPCTKKKGDV